MQNVRLDEDQVVLSCWKDIARYLGKGVRTVQRWEQNWDLPVRRPNGCSVKGPVAARPADLDRWISDRWSQRASGRKHRTMTLVKTPQQPVLAESLPPQPPLHGKPFILASRPLRNENCVPKSGSQRRKNRTP
jgi:hypothetical protein